MAFWYRLGVAVGVTVLVSCGNPTPEHPASGHSTRSADAVLSLPAGSGPSAGPAVNESARQDPTQALPLGLTAQQVLKSSALIATDPRATNPVYGSRAQTEPSSSDRPPPDQAQQAARHSWYAEVRDSPDVIVRLQALEFWAQQPGDALDPVTYSLVDGDESVRARAQELLEQQLTREAVATQPVKEEEGYGGQIKQ